MRTAAAAFIVGATALAGCGSAPAGPGPCAPRASFEPTGFFRVAQDCGRWTLVAPDGARFFSTGVNHASWGGEAERGTGANPYRDAVRAKHADEAAWARATAERLQAWGWNTAGAWSSASLGAHLPYATNLGIGGAGWLSGDIADYFAPAFREAVEAAAEARVRPLAADPNLIGWFLDNEMHWGPDWRRSTTLLDDYAKLGPEAPGKQALVDWLRARHADVASFNAAWGTALGSWDDLARAQALPAPRTQQARADRSDFVRLAARRFFETTVGAVRARDPNHLILGVRFVATLVPQEVAEVAGEFLDVVSANAYEFVVDPQEAWSPEIHGLVDLRDGGFLEGLHGATGRPLLISEFGFRAADAGLPNSWPPIYPVLATQAERADRFETYARRCRAAPWIVGYHWFEFVDQPAGGRFDGEDNNWGLVDVRDEPYATLVGRTARVNRAPP